jgi:hypothetical protein
MKEMYYTLVIKEWVYGKLIEKKYKINNDLASKLSTRKAMQFVANELYGSRTCLISVVEKDDGMACQIWKPDNSIVDALLSIKE